MDALFPRNTTVTKKSAQEDGKEEESEGITRVKEIISR
jgi:hypothetical protein